MSTVIASLALVAIVGGAITYIVKEKRKGTKCIGCPVSSDCTFNPMVASSSGNHHNLQIVGITNQAGEPKCHCH
ncbi:FeoB-associated Cys-rich membrane protein [Varibaculum cambriense]|uniref:FeoB-associated Cys-rich membrane protein n=1 Tax=Varibaculum cambriense TaxID=184870 RepID=UPI000C7E45A3|nr:FeoB-associated Cys-rich membrane protein [Varibaculum cambriense]WIK88764.1 FeoB-associated Cys-rich membrane protein [Varibaculum cambriense]